MAKQGEIDYLARLGPAGIDHARGKPFSDPQCGAFLADFGGLFMLLPPPPAAVLDLGCGSGWTSVLLARRGYEVTGVDIAPDMIALAEANRAAAGLANVRFASSDYEGLEFRDAFDVALFYDSLHHAVDPAAAIASAWRALKPGGWLVSVEPGAGHGETEAARGAVAAFDVTERDMPPSLVLALGRAAGFEAGRIHPMPKMLLALQYESRLPRGLPAVLEPFYRWLLAGWVGVVRRRHYGAVVMQQKAQTG